MERREPKRPYRFRRFHLVLATILAGLGSTTTTQAQVIEGDGWRLHKIPSHRSETFHGGNPYADDTYSFVHQTGAQINGQFQCFSEHLSGTDDNTVVFDGMTEFLDPYMDGTQPELLEFEVTRGSGTSEITFNSFLDSGTDLFPDGFEDPDTGTPLTDACVEIGIEDTLDPVAPTTVTSAMLQFFGSPGFGPVDITSFFSNPWDGRLSVVLSNFAGVDTTGVVLQLDLEPDPMPIFTDGFESGNTSAWTQ